MHPGPVVPPAPSGELLALDSVPVMTLAGQALYLTNRFRQAEGPLGKQAVTRLFQRQAESDVARWIVRQRRQLRAEIRAAAPALCRRIAEQFNERRYGHPLGPSYEQLVDIARSQGKNPLAIDREIIRNERGDIPAAFTVIVAAGQDRPFLLREHAQPASDDGDTDDPSPPPVRPQIDGIPASSPVDDQGHLQPAFHLVVDLLDPGIGGLSTIEPMALADLDLAVTYRDQGVRWTVPAKSTAEVSTPSP